MNIGILAPDNPHKGLHRDAELLAWALSEGGFKSIEILHLKNIRSDVVSTKSTNSGAPSIWSVSEGVYLDEWLHKLDVLFLSEVFNLGLVEKIVPVIKVVYIPNLEWTIMKGEEGEVASWITNVRNFLNNGLTVLAKTNTAGQVLEQHDIDCTVVDWSVPDKIRKTKRKPSSKDEIRVLMNAGLGGWKSRRGVDVMIEAINNMPEKHNFNFVLKTIKPWEEYGLGECPESVELVEGFLSRKDMDKLVDSADLIIYPSRFEGFGLSQLEALHRGIPVMCTDGWPMNELQTIEDERLLIRVKEMTPLRLAWSFEPSSNSIVDNLMSLSDENPCITFPTVQVTKGLGEKQKNFVSQLRDVVTDLEDNGD